MGSAFEDACTILQLSLFLPNAILLEAAVLLIQYYLASLCLGLLRRGSPSDDATDLLMLKVLDETVSTLIFEGQVSTHYKSNHQQSKRLCCELPCFCYPSHAIFSLAVATNMAKSLQVSRAGASGQLHLIACYIFWYMLSWNAYLAYAQCC